jgi:magnesium transporter
MIKEIRGSGIIPGGLTIKSTLKNTDDALLFSKKCLMVWLDFVVDDISLGTKEVVEKMNLPVEPSSLFSGYLSNYEDKVEILGLMIPVVKFEERKLTTTNLLIYTRRDQIVTIHDEYMGHLKLEQYSDVFMKKLPMLESDWGERTTLLLARIIDEISERNFRILGSIIEQADLIQNTLLESGAREVSFELFEMKRSMITFLNVTWSIHDLVHSLRYGDAEMISDREEVLAKFEPIISELGREVSIAQQIADSVATTVNVLQTDISNKMTTLLIWLTIIGTAVLVPNTLATIYGIPFLPLNQALHSPMIVYSLIATTIISTLVAYWYVWRWAKRPRLRRFIRLRRKNKKPS